MSRKGKVTRRTFVRSIVGSAALAGMAGTLSSLDALGMRTTPDPQMPERALGNTGHRVRIFSLGGQAALEDGDMTDEALKIINRAIDLGVNYLDTAAAYGDGVSEKVVGTVMKSRRKEVFLASKTHSRSRDGSLRLLERSLKNLQTDHLDLWQLHNVRTDDDLDRIFGKDGAIHALEEARSQKMVRFLGITGHRDPFVLRTGIQRYPFDSILMALNAADRHRASFIDNVLPAAVRNKMSIVGMKIPARGKIFREGGITTMKQAMGYVLTLPVSTMIVGISRVSELEENVAIARAFTPYSDSEMKEIENLTAAYYAEASWFKTLW